MEKSKNVKKLVKVISKLLGIHDVDGIGGYDHRVVVSFHVEVGEPRGLFVLVRCSDRRYWKYGHVWDLKLEVGDIPCAPLPIIYKLESELAEADQQAEDLIRNIKEHLQCDGFLKGYGLEVLRGCTG